MGNGEKVVQGSAMVTPRNQNRSRVSHRGTRTCDEPPHPLRILAGDNLGVAGTGFHPILSIIVL